VPEDEAMSKRVLFYYGPGDDSEFCDHDDADDDVECDDDHLYAIEEDGELVGYVCANHKAAYKKQAGIE
jgi:hypothetical protein